MNADVKRLWLEALRSGEYKQGRGRLRTAGEDSYCCLGVLCDVHAKAGLGEWGRCYDYHGFTASLPGVVVRWAGLPDTNPGVAGASLSKWNDVHGSSFEEIADVIEKEL